MKAVAKTGYGPFRLEYMEVPKPVCGDNDIILKVKAAGICGSDMPLLYGPDEAKYKGYTYPMVIGHEFAGKSVKWDEMSRIGQLGTVWCRTIPVMCAAAVPRAKQEISCFAPNARASEGIWTAAWPNM